MYDSFPSPGTGRLHRGFGPDTRRPHGGGVRLNPSGNLNLSTPPRTRPLLLTGPGPTRGNSPGRRGRSFRTSILRHRSSSTGSKLTDARSRGSSHSPDPRSNPSGRSSLLLLLDDGPRVKPGLDHGTRTPPGDDPGVPAGHRRRGGSGGFSARVTSSGGSNGPGSSSVPRVPLPSPTPPGVSSGNYPRPLGPGTGPPAVPHRPLVSSFPSQRRSRESWRS